MYLLDSLENVRWKFNEVILPSSYVAGPSPGEGVPRGAELP